MKMSTKHDRLRQARIAAGFKRMSDAVRELGWKQPGYKGHENGNAVYSYEMAKMYGKAYNVIAAWLYDDDYRGPMRPTNEAPVQQLIPIVGKAAAGPEGHFMDPYPDGGHPTLDPFPEGSIAVDVSGDSMEPRFFSGEKIIFGPVANEISRHSGEEVLAHLADGRNLIKILEADRSSGLYNLRSYNPRHEPITSAPIVWVRPFLGLTSK